MINKVVSSIIVSDLHLSDAQPYDAKKPLWKKFKYKEFFIDQDFSKFIDILLATYLHPMELILNGDIFDFDSVMKIPEKPEFAIAEYELKFGLNPSEEKSVYKIDVILSQHPEWVNSLIRFIKAGNKIVFVIGNHDIELNWVRVQKRIQKFLGLSFEESKRVIFCEWYYVSNNDTLIEHGHQYDPYCMSLDPVDPIIKKNGEYRMRLPFGNLANRFMINAMGFKNPHNDESYVKSFTEFIEFFLKYELKNQPLIALDWIKGAMRTLIYSIGESFLPKVRDPMTNKEKLKKIAKKANSSVQTLIDIKENHAHPAVRNPFSIIRELWLDRAFLLVAFIFLSWQLFSLFAVFISLSINWFFLPMTIFLFLFGYYAHGVGSEIRTNQSFAEDSSILTAQLCGVKRIVLGHTHSVYHKQYKKYELLNPGTWSVFFRDVECTQKESLFTFVLIQPGKTSERIAKILEYKDGKIIDINIQKEIKPEHIAKIS